MWARDERPAHVATVPAPDGYRGAYRRGEEVWAERYAATIDGAARDLGGRGLAAMYIDPAFTAVTGGKYLKCLSWYDNEWGYSNRVCDLLGLIARWG